MRKVNALLERGDRDAAHRWIQEVAGWDEPDGRVQDLEEPYWKAVTDEVTRLTGLALESAGDLDAAMRTLQSAEALVRDLPDAATASPRLPEMRRRLWWSYTKLGVQCLEGGDEGPALEPLYHALRLAEGDADRETETRHSLAQALDAMAARASNAIAEWLRAGGQTTAEAAGQALCRAIDRALAEGRIAGGAGGRARQAPARDGAHRRGRRAMSDPSPALALGDLLDGAAARYPDREAVVFRDERVTYRELKRRADDFARGLLDLGVRPGDHVVLWMPNRTEWNVANLGIAKIGAVTVTCNSRYKAYEVEYVLRQSDAKALIMVDRFAAAKVDYLAILDELLPEAREAGPLRSARFPALRHLVVLGEAVPAGARAFEAVERAGERPGAAALGGIVVRPDDPVEMLYTSGTTGEPKGCLLSHGNMYYKCRVYVDLHRWTHADRYLVPVPYFHIFGSMGGVAANCLAGSTQVVMEVFDAGEAMRLIEAERVTIFSGVPTMFITLLGHPAFGTFDLSSLRTGSIGAAPVPVEIMRRILDREAGLGMDALVVYGLTEATGGTHWTRAGRSHREAGGHGGTAHAGDRGPHRGSRDRPPAAAGTGGRGLHQGADPHAGLLQEARCHRGQGPRRMAAHG